VSFDPGSGEVIERHVQLNPDEAYAGIVYDRNHHRLYALPQDRRDLYVINAETLQTVDRVALRVDPRVPGLTDTVALAYDSITNTLYTVIGHWTNYPNGPIWSQLATIEPETGELTIIGRIDGPWIATLAFSETDRRLYATGVYDAGSWDSPSPTHVMRIDPGTAKSDTIFLAPYHTMLGFAIREPLTFFSWINWDSHFYGRTDLPTQTVTPLGPADRVGVVYAMTYKNFSLPPRAVPIPAEPASFTFDGIVSQVWNPDGRLAGSVEVGHRFAGKFSYDAAAPFKWPDPNRSPPYGFSLSINGLKYASAGLTASITDDRYDWTDQSLTDAFSLGAYTYPHARISWTLIDPTGRAVEGNGKLPDVFDLSEWEGNHFSITGYDPGSDFAVYHISGTVDRVTRRQQRAAQLLSHPRPRIGRVVRES